MEKTQSHWQRLRRAHYLRIAGLGFLAAVLLLVGLGFDAAAVILGAVGLAVLYLSRREAPGLRTSLQRCLPRHAEAVAPRRR